SLRSLGVLASWRLSLLFDELGEEADVLGLVGEVGFGDGPRVDGPVAVEIGVRLLWGLSRGRGEGSRSSARETAAVGGAARIPGVGGVRAAGDVARRGGVVR